MDDSFRRILRPVDGRGKRGVYSRGKPNYPGAANVPNAGPIAEIARKRLRKKMGNGRYPTSRPRPST